MFAYVRLCSPMFAYVRLCSPMFAYVRLCSPMFAYVRLCSPMFAYVRLCSPMFAYVRLCSLLFAYVRLMGKKMLQGHGERGQIDWDDRDSVPELLMYEGRKPRVSDEGCGMTNDEPWSLFSPKH